MSRKPSRVNHEGLLHRMSIQSLLIFRDAFRNPGSSVKECAAIIGHPKSNVGRVMNDVREGLELGVKGKEDIWDQLRSAHPEDTIAGRFYSVVCEFIDGLERVKANRDKPRTRIFVAGGEFALICVMPRVLQLSKFLEKHKGISLDLRRLFPEEAVRAVELGQADIALTPSPNRPTLVNNHNLLQAGCGFIYRYCDSVNVGAAALRMMKIGIPGKSSGLRSAGAFLVFVAIYHYVAKQVGVGLYYIPEFDPFAKLPSGVKVIRLKAEPPYPDAVFHLYWVDKLTPEAEELRQAIIQYADPR